MQNHDQELSGKATNLTFIINETLARSQSAFPSLPNHMGSVRTSQVNEMKDIHNETVRVAIWFGKKAKLRKQELIMYPQNR